MNGVLTIADIDERNRYSENHYGSMEQQSGELETYLFSTLASANDIKYYQGVCDSYRILALYYTIKSNVDQAKQALDNAQKIFDKHQLQEEDNLMLYNTYVVFYFDGVYDMEKAAQYCKIGIEKADFFGNKKLLARLKANFAVINLELKHYNIALELLLNTLELYESNDEKNNRMYCYNNIGETYYMLNQITKAREYYEKALDMAFKLNEIAIIHDASLGLSKVYMSLELYDKSASILESVILYSQTYENERLVVEAELALVDVLYQIEKFKEAYELLATIEKREILFDKSKDEIHYYEMKAKIADKTKDYEMAYRSVTKKMELLQQIDTSNNTSVINEIMENEYKKTIKRLETIAKIGRELTTLHQLDDVVIDVAQKLKELLFLDCIGIGELKDAFIEYNHFYDEGIKLKPHKKAIDDEQSLAIWCVNNKKEVLINDINSEYHAYVKLVNYYGNDNSNRTPTIGKIAQSIMYAPLLIKDQVIGVFTIQSFEKDAYSTEEFEIFKIISSYVAIALQNINQAKAFKELSVRDTLTGLLNRRGFTEAYDEYILKRHHHIKSLALIMMDLDYFKQINDTYGHLVGDEVLLKIGRFLNSLNHGYELTARLGGEEFALFIINETKERVDSIAEYIRSEIEKLTILHKELEISVTTSVGVAFNHGHQMLRYKELYYKADKALYQAKDMGRNRVCWFDQEPTTLNTVTTANT